MIDYFRILISSRFFRIIWISFSFRTAIKQCVKLEGIMLYECKNYLIIIVIGSYRDWSWLDNYDGIFSATLHNNLAFDRSFCSGRKTEQNPHGSKKPWTYSIYLKFKNSQSRPITMQVTKYKSWIFGFCYSLRVIMNMNKPPDETLNQGCL